jgi:hypothetical protein
LISLEKEPYYQNLLQPKQHVFSFGEILHRGDREQNQCLSYKGFFWKNGPKSPDFEELFVEIVRFRYLAG